MCSGDAGVCGVSAGVWGVQRVWGVVQCGERGGVCCWGCGVCAVRYPLDGLKAKKCLPLLW